MSRQLGQVGQDGLVPDKFDITPGEIHNNTNRRLRECMSATTGSAMTATALQCSLFFHQRWACNGRDQTCSQPGHDSTSVDADGHSSVHRVRRSRTAKEDGGSRPGRYACRFWCHQGLATSPVEFTGHLPCRSTRCRARYPSTHRLQKVR